MGKNKKPTIENEQIWWLNDSDYYYINQHETNLFFNFVDDGCPGTLFDWKYCTFLLIVDSDWQL